MLFDFAAYDVKKGEPSVLHRLISFLFSAGYKTYVTLAGLLTIPVFNSFPSRCVGIVGYLLKTMMLTYINNRITAAGTVAEFNTNDNYY